MEYSVEGAKQEKQKRNSYDTTLNFFVNYLFLPVDIIITLK